MAIKALTYLINSSTANANQYLALQPPLIQGFQIPPVLR